MHKNEPKKVKISIFSPLKGFFDKMWKSVPPLNFDFMGGLVSATFSEILSKRLQIEFFPFKGWFIGILGANLEKIIKKIFQVVNSVGL